MEQIIFGECPICRQGQLTAMTSISTGQMVVMCDDCESQWRSPSDAESFEKALKEELRDIRPATLDEVHQAGWEFDA